jgi:uncharacterized protein YxjI
MKSLPKKILNLLTKQELKILDNFSKKDIKLEEKMLKVQTDYSIADRKGILSEAHLQQMSNNGFKVEYELFKLRDEREAYINKLRKKYS